MDEKTFLGLGPEAWSALIAGVAAIWAIAQNSIEWRRARFIQGIKTLDEKVIEFRAPHLKQARIKSALYLLSSSTDEPPEELFELLNFFEGLGYLCARKLLEREAVWNHFSTWIIPFMHAANRQIVEIRVKDEGLYQNALDLTEKLEKIEDKKHKSKSHLHLKSKDFMKKFLTAEAGKRLSSGEE